MIIYLYPNGAFISQHTPVGAVANWDCLDEDPHDSDTTYVHFEVTGGSPIIRQTISDLTNEPGFPSNAIVTSVTCEVIARKTAGSLNTVTPQVRLGSNTQSGSAQAVSGSYVTYTATLSRPGGGSWTAADLNSLRGGFLTTTQDDLVTPANTYVTRNRIAVDMPRPFLPSGAGSASATGTQPSFVKGRVFHPVSGVAYARGATHIEFIHPAFEDHMGIVYDLRGRFNVKRGLSN